jgi:uncharacterized protein YbbK (DUF523 family)
MYLVSACLIGVNCRFDGNNSLSDRVINFLDGKEYTPICPEQLGGLPTPRPPCRFYGGDGDSVLRNQARLVNSEGIDVTENFKRGANESLKIARATKSTHAVLKERSPSCGVSEIYIDDGLTRGMGVTAALLKQEGIEIISDEEI